MTTLKHTTTLFALCATLALSTGCFDVPGSTGAGGGNSNGGTATEEGLVDANGDGVADSDCTGDSFSGPNSQGTVSEGCEPGGFPEDGMWGDDPCIEMLDTCLAEAGEDPMVAEECFILYDTCWYELECIDPATGEDYCGGWGDPGDGIWTDDPCIDPFTGEDLCNGWGDLDPFGDPCLGLFDECLALGVSPATCEVALDECIVAQEPIVDESCDLMLADCLYAGLGADFCFAGYDECLTGAVKPPVVDPQVPLADPCGDAFIACVDSGRPEQVCADELLACDMGMN